MSNQDPDQFNRTDQDTVGDVDGESYIPPDEPMASHAFGTTEAEERAGETFEQRDRHTQPEVSEADLHDEEDRVARLVQVGDEDVDDIDDEATATAREDESSVDVSAEEAAMHFTENP